MYHFGTVDCAETIQIYWKLSRSFPGKYALNYLHYTFVFG
jgi:hypothetical protein